VIFKAIPFFYRGVSMNADQYWTLRHQKKTIDTTQLDKELDRKANMFYKVLPPLRSGRARRVPATLHALCCPRRMIDFEQALATLDTAHQLALILTYRDRQGHAATAAGCIVRTLAYMLPAARRRLADVLDRRDLLRSSLAISSKADFFMYDTRHPELKKAC
jgi:hypothetical protein